MARRKEIIEVPKNNRLIDALTPIGMQFNKSSSYVGEMETEVLHVFSYPSTLQTAWLSKLTKLSGVTVSSYIEPTDPSILTSSMKDKLKELNMQISGNSINQLSQDRIKKEIQDIRDLRIEIEEKNQKIVFMSVSIKIRARDKDDLENIKRRVKNVASSNGLILRPVSMKQQDSLKMSSPYFQPSDVITSKIKQIMPISTASASFPFNNSGVNHGKGLLIGKDSGGGILLIDLWRRGGDITNSNFTILGVAGVGKSATVKTIIEQSFAQGVKVMILDPDREYKTLCHNNGGSWVNLGGGKGGRINPYQVKNTPMDIDEGEDEKSDFLGGDTAVRLHFQFLRTFHKMYLGALSDSELSLIEDICEKAYAKKNIYYDTDISKLTPEDYPLMQDIYETTLEEQKKDEISETMLVRYENIALALRAGAIGADSNLWNGITTLEAEDDFVVLDTFDLQKSDINLKRTMYFNACTWLWEQASKNRDEKVLIIIDEAYLMADPEVPQSLMFLRDVEKRGRKYNVGLGIISHSVVDFLHDKIKEYGQALLDIPSFKFFMGTDGKNLKEAIEIMQFTDKEADILAEKIRGHGIMYVGAKKIHAIINIEPWEEELFGKSGGN